MALDVFLHQYGLVREEHLPLLHFTLLDLEIVQPGRSYDILLLGKQRHLVSCHSLPCLLLKLIPKILLLIASVHFPKHRHGSPLISLRSIGG